MEMKANHSITAKGIALDYSLANYHIIKYKNRQYRVVPPYSHEFRTNFKPRWSELTVREIYVKEFCNSASQEREVDDAISEGRIRVNGESSAATRKLKLGDAVTHLTHRHEPPVIYKSTTELIAFDDQNFVVVNKPASIPVHPCGPYKFNTMIYILAKERPELGELFITHRLDRLTSGLLLFARSSAASRRVAKAIQGNTVGFEIKKSYIAKVVGKFPTNLRECTISHSHIETSENSKWILVNCPIAELDPKKGLNKCDAEGKKNSRSRFLLLSYDTESNTSVVKCEPLSGRTHQLRLHLQLIGHPIANDTTYGGNENTIQTNDAVNEGSEEEDNFDTICKSTFQQLADPSCEECKKPFECLNQSEIWLHATRYRIYENNQLSYDFRVPFPHWVNSDELKDQFFDHE